MAHKLWGVLAFNLIILQHILDHLMEKKYFAKPFQLLKNFVFWEKKYFSLEQNRYLAESFTFKTSNR